MYAKIVIALLALLALTSSATAGTTVPLGTEVTGMWCYDRARDNYSRGKCRAARLLKVNADGWEVLGKKCSIQESHRRTSRPRSVTWRVPTRPGTTRTSGSF
jgi:hypothetical protein